MFDPLHLDFMINKCAGPESYPIIWPKLQVNETEVKANMTATSVRFSRSGQ